MPGSLNCPCRLDLNFWYGSGPGCPAARAQGIGYVQELVARLTKTPVETVCCDRLISFAFGLVDHSDLVQHNSTTNSTLDNNPITFPLDGRPLYVDATHEVVVANGKPSFLAREFTLTAFPSPYCSQPFILRCGWTASVRSYTKG